MELEDDEERVAALESWSIRVYQQLQAGYPIDAIRAQFNRIVDATPEDIRYISETAKARYNGYFESRRTANRQGANWLVLGGIGVILLAVAILSQIGWSTAPRQNGKAIAAFLIGTGCLCYGAWSWFDAEPKGKRTDLDDL